MKLKVTPGLVLSLSLALFVAYYLFFERFLHARSSIGLSALGAFLTLVGVWRFLQGMARFGDIRRMLRWQQAGAVEVMKDGEKVLVFGHIYAFNETIHSPFTQRPCIYYDYKVTHWAWHDNHRELATDFRGRQLIPSYVQTLSGKVMLLAVPELMGFEEGGFAYDEETRNVYEQAFRYIKGTSFR